MGPTVPGAADRARSRVWQSGDEGRRERICRRGPKTGRPASNVSFLAAAPFGDPCVHREKTAARTIQSCVRAAPPVQLLACAEVTQRFRPRQSRRGLQFARRHQHHHRCGVGRSVPPYGDFGAKRSVEAAARHAVGGSAAGLLSSRRCGVGEQSRRTDDDARILP